MSPQKNATITKQAPELYMVNGDNQWTLEGPIRTLKIESPSASTATNMGI